MTAVTVNGYRRVTKQAARRLYESGKEIFLCPVRLLPGGYWSPEIRVQINTRPVISGDGFTNIVPRDRTFEAVVNCFTYYNCLNNETGRYAAFYVKGE